MGVHPVAFSGGFIEGCSTVFPSERCEKIWPQQRWQNAYNASREHLARMIADAEEDVLAYLDYPVAPEAHKKVFVLDDREKEAIQRGYAAVLVLPHYKINAIGEFTETTIDAAASVVLTDEDGDGFKEIATITVNILEADFTSVEEYNLYIDGQYKVDPLVSRSYDSNTGDLVLKAYAWQLIKPDKLYQYPVADVYYGIDLCSTDSYVADIHVIRRSKTDGATAVTFTDSNGNTYTGDWYVLEGEYGLIRVSLPDACLGPLQWGSYCDYPILSVEVKYITGPEKYDRKGNLIPAHMDEVAQIAAARLEQSVCACGCNQEEIDSYREDWAIATGNSVRRITMADLQNPFGTRAGEVYAYRSLKNEKPVAEYAGLIIG